MKRRRVLGTMVVVPTLVAGCLGGGDAGSDSDSPGAGGCTERGVLEAYAAVSVPDETSVYEAEATALTESDSGRHLLSIAESNYNPGMESAIEPAEETLSSNQLAQTSSPELAASGISEEIGDERYLEYNDVVFVIHYTTVAC